MRRRHRELGGVLPGLIFVAFLAGPLAFPKDKKDWPDPLPLFMDPGFHFSQIDTLCLAPALDLRSDQTAPLSLSERGVRTGIFPNEHIHSADQTLAEDFKFNGYRTTDCNPVTATLNDFRSSSDAWLRSLNFGQSNWLFVVGVESVNSSANWLGGKGGSAIVSGFLFERQTDSVKLVWRERDIGVAEAGYTGRKGTVERGQVEIAVNNGILHLTSRFERRSRGRPFAFVVEEENFGTSCDGVWNVLKETLNNDPKKYSVVFLDASDKMALYMRQRDLFKDNENHLVLRTHEAGCVIEFTQMIDMFKGKTANGWDELTKQMHASLAK